MLKRRRDRRNEESLNPGSEWKSSTLNPSHPSRLLPVDLRIIKFLVNCWQKTLTENAGMPSPTSTHGGSKGLALERLRTSAGEHCPQHKDVCAFLKGKRSFPALYIIGRGAKMFSSEI